MNFVGVGAFELVLVAIVAVIVLGPDNLTRPFWQVAERIWSRHR